MTWRPKTTTDCGNFTVRLRQPSKLRSPFFIHTGTFVSERNNKLGLVGKHDRRPLLCHPIFLLPASLQPLLLLFGIEQRFYSWYAAAESLFMQPSMWYSVRCLHSCLLPHPSQLLGTAKPVLFSQSSQLVTISLRGRPFPATVLPITTRIS